jgi:hypothetical protein
VNFAFSNRDGHIIYCDRSAESLHDVSRLDDDISRRTCLFGHMCGSFAMGV